MLFAFFGLGLPEILILGMLCVVPATIGGVLLVVMLNKKPKDRRRRDDGIDES